MGGSKQSARRDVSVQSANERFVMSLQTLILVALKLSILLTVFAIGLRATVKDATSLFRRPGHLVRALLAMNVLMPVFAVALVLLFDLKQPVRIALVALAISPVPPILPRKLTKAGATESYAVGLLVAVGLLAIIFVPAAVVILDQVSMAPLRMTFGTVAALVFMTVMLPLGLGIAVNRLAPALAERLVKPISKFGFMGLLLCAAAILISTAPAIWALVGNGTLVAITAFVLVGLVIGHLLGGPEPENRTALAMATASHHPGIAIALATANFPEEKSAMAAVLLYLLINVLASISYYLWTRGPLPDVEKQVGT
jgi:bile acid:Na+ symporter, BASS family